MALMTECAAEQSFASAEPHTAARAAAVAPLPALIAVAKAADSAAIP